MRLIKLKPITNGLRHKIKIQKNLLSKSNRILKKLNKGFKQFHGRSRSTGRITSWHKGGGSKRLFRKTEENLSQDLLVLTTCYDPIKSSFINLNFEVKKKKFFYSIAPEYVYTGSLIRNTNVSDELKLGFRNQIKNIPAGSIIHNLQINSNKNSQYIKSAGAYGQIIQIDAKKTKIKLPSKKIVEVLSKNMVSIGITSNILHKNIIIGKAGTKRLLSRRPITRGIAMNPVDHPHGGRTNGGRPSVTPWGLPTKCKFKLKKKK